MKIEKRIDWHLFLGPVGIVITLATITIGCFFNLSSSISEVNKEIVKIQTILIIKGIAPSDLFSSNEDSK